MPSVVQHAIRILVILDACGEPGKTSDPVGAVAVIRVIRAELRLQTLDFWLRNPDYLSDEILAKAEAGDLLESCPGTGMGGGE